MNRVLDQTRNVVISCHDFLRLSRESRIPQDERPDCQRTEVRGLQRSHRVDERGFVADYVYGTRDERTGP